MVKSYPTQSTSCVTAGLPLIKLTDIETIPDQSVFSRSTGYLIDGGSIQDQPVCEKKLKEKFYRLVLL